MDFPGGSVVRNLPANAGDTGPIPGWGRCPGEGNGYPLQYSGPENPVDRGAWLATIHGVAKESGGTKLKQQQRELSVRGTAWVRPGPDLLARCPAGHLHATGPEQP